MSDLEDRTGILGHAYGERQDTSSDSSCPRPGEYGISHYHVINLVGIFGHPSSYRFLPSLDQRL